MLTFKRMSKGYILWPVLFRWLEEIALKFAKGVSGNFLKWVFFFFLNKWKQSKIKGAVATALLWKDKTQLWLKIASLTADEKEAHLVQRMDLSGDALAKVPEAFMTPWQCQHDDAPKKLKWKTGRAYSLHCLEWNVTVCPLRLGLFYLSKGLPLPSLWLSLYRGGRGSEICDRKCHGEILCFVC